MHYDIVELPALPLVGHKILTRAFSRDIFDLWTRYGPLLSRLPQASPLDHKFGVCTNPSESAASGPPTAAELENFTPPKIGYMASVLVQASADGLDNLPDDLEFLTLPARKYLHFEHHGPIAEYGKTLQAIGTTITEHKLEIDHSFDLERYDVRFDPTGADSVVDLYYPLPEA